MRKMRGVGQLALASADPLRVAEFYESAFGFIRRAADETGALPSRLENELSTVRSELVRMREVVERMEATHQVEQHHEGGV